MVRCGQLTVSNESLLIVEGPREADFEYPRIERIVCHLEVVPLSPEVLVPVFEFQEDPHSFPFGCDECVQQYVVAILFLPLVVELRGGRVVTEGVVGGVVAPVYADLQPQYVFHHVEFVVVGEESADQRNGNDSLICAPLHQYPMIQM